MRLIPLIGPKLKIFQRTIMRIESLIGKFRTTIDGVELHRIVQKLEKSAHKDRELVIAAFLEYMQTGQLNHWRGMIIPNAIDLIEEGESQYADIFRWGLADQTTAYWSVLGLAKSLQKASYSELTAFALNEQNATDARAHAIQVLAGLSKQTFNRGLPSDPGYWAIDRLPLSSLVCWRDKGFPDGTGFKQPVVSSALAKPQTEIDKLAAKLEAKLQRYRAENQDLANPTNWLVPANRNDLKRVASQWNLPERYLEFITKFSPLNVTIYGKGCGQGIELFGAGELIAAQFGYSCNPVTSTPITDWNSAHIVIAAEAGDPYVLDLSAMKGDDCPVLTALHGQGTWCFSRSATNFLAFLRRLG
jgi:hypothetical protein